MSALVPLDRVTPISIDPGAQVIVSGCVRTTVDGSTFDALMQWDGLAPARSTRARLPLPFAASVEDSGGPHA
jgi:hypothetical protein